MNHQRPKSDQLPRHCRRGSVYIIVLGAAMLVALIGVSGVAAVRLQRRVAGNATDAVHAHWLAQGAIEAGRAWVDGNAGWRTTAVNNNWVTTPRDCGGGKIRYKFIDPLDGNLADDAGEAVVLLGEGRFGDAKRSISVRLEPDPVSGEMGYVAGSWRREVE